MSTPTKESAYKDFSAKTEIVVNKVFKAVTILVVIALVLYQILFAVSYWALTTYQEYKQEQATQKQQESLKQLQQEQE